MHFAALVSKWKSKTAPSTSANRAKKIKTIQVLVQRLASEKGSYERASLGQYRGCLLAPLLPFSSLSPLPSVSFLFLLSSLLLSPFCFQKPMWGSAYQRQESSHTDYTWASRVNLRAVGACETSVLFIALRSLKTGLLVRPKRKNKNQQKPIVAKNVFIEYEICCVLCFMISLMLNG